MVSCKPGRANGQHSAFFMAHDGMVDLLWKNVNNINIDCNKNFDTFTCCNGSDCRDFNCPGNHPAREDIENLKNAIIQYSRTGEFSSPKGSSLAESNLSTRTSTSSGDSSPTTSTSSTYVTPKTEGTTVTVATTVTENRINAGSRLNMRSVLILLMLSSFVSLA